MKKFLFFLAVVGGIGFYLRTHYYLIDIMDYVRANKDSSLDSPGVEYYVGLTYFLRERYEPASRCFNQLVTDFPQSSYTEGALFRMGESYEQQHDWQNARNAYQAYMDQFPAGKETATVRGHYEHIKFN